MDGYYCHFSTFTFFFLRNYFIQYYTHHFCYLFLCTYSNESCFYDVTLLLDFVSHGNNVITVDSRYLEIEGTIINSSRYPYFDISDL